MGKISKAFDVMDYILKNPKRVAKYILENKSIILGEEKPSDESLFLKEVELSDVIGTDFPEVWPVSYLSDGSTVPDYILLNGLAKKISECDYLEIGTWRGESICNVARYAKTCTSVSLPENIYPETWRKSLDFYCKKYNLTQIDLRKANSLDFDFATLEKKFDLIFIDGDHSYEGILNDTKKAIPLMKNEKTIIVWHDYMELHEKVADNTLRAILDGVPEKWHNNLYYVRNTFCAILYFEDVKNYAYETFPRVPNRAYEVSVKEIE